MKLSNLYKNEISRPVNPAVSVTDNNSRTIQTEIDEYVFTDDIILNLYNLLYTFRETHKMQDGKLNKTHSHVGVWVDGYYGSGKSHFLKYLSYCTSPEHTDRAMKRLIDAVRDIDPYDPNHKPLPEVSTLEDMARWLKTAMIQTCSINLLTYRNDNNRSRRNTFLNIFWSQFNRMRGYNDSEFALAQHLEKALDEVGQLDSWHRQMASMNFDIINMPGVAPALAGRYLNVAIEEARKLAPSLDYEGIRSRILNPRDIVSPETFGQELKEYLDKQPNGGKDYRILFLADEVSIFINNDLGVLGQLQELVTRVGELTDNRVWIVCTAQQELEKVITGCKVQETTDEYGKIMGRFEVRKSLESTSAKYITQQRILDKKPEVIPMLEKIYTSKKTALDNQYTLPAGYAKFDSKDSFVAYYPFVPFQLDLVLKVFEAFQEKGYVMKEVKDNQRSIIRVTHATAKSTKDEEVGQFMAFDQFYNTMFQNSLQATGTKAIDNAVQAIKEYADPAFGRRVVNVLFMICNLLQKDSQVFPATLDNLTILLMNDIDENKLALREKIQGVTSFLVENHILRVDKTDKNVEFFSFFTEEQREVARAIEMQSIDSNFLAEQLTKAIFPRLLGAAKNKEHYMNRDFAMRYSVLGRFLYSGQDVTVDFCFDSPEANFDMHLFRTNVPRNQLTFFLAPQYNTDEELMKAVSWYCKVQKVQSVSGNSISSTILKEFTTRAEMLFTDEILPKLAQIFDTCPVATGNQPLSPAQLGSLHKAERYRKALDLHFLNLYNKASMVQGSEIPSNMATLKTLIKRPVTDGEYDLKPMSDAEQEVSNYINRMLNMHEVTLSELVREYEKAPYGWNGFATLYVVNELVRRRMYDYAFNNSIDVDTNQIAATIDSQQQHISLRTAQLISQTLINDFISAWNYIFADVRSMATADGRELCRQCREGDDDHSLDHRIQTYNEYARKAGNYPFAPALNKAIEALEGWKKLRDPEKFFQKMIDEKETGRELMEESKKVIQFMTPQTMQRYQQVLAFLDNNRYNFDHLPDDMHDTVKALQAIREDKLPKMQNYAQLMQKLTAAIRQQTQTLREGVIQAFTTAYAELRKLCDERQIEHTFLPDEEGTKARRSQSDNLLQLKNNIDAQPFVTEWTQKIIDEYNRRNRGPREVTVHLNCPTRKLTSEQDVDLYVAALKQQLMDKLIEGEQNVLVMS